MIKRRILPIIIIAQFFCTSLWFAGNVVLPDLDQEFQLPSNSYIFITSAVQLGFILASLVFAILNISDRFSPSKVFFTCALIGAICNMGIFITTGFWSIILIRFLTGICLAGIYPVGLKLAVDYYEKGLGKALGYLVGALVLGTALPHLLKSITSTLHWEYVIIYTSALCLTGSLLIVLFVPDGPHRKAASNISFGVIPSIFKIKNLRAAALGYIGHMWELYTFWSVVPAIILLYCKNGAQLNTSLWSCIIISSGSFACVIGGYVALKKGSSNVAFVTLSISFCCCLLSVFVVQMPVTIFIAFMLIWGMAIIADSPQFSTLVAQNTPAEIKGSALTIINAMGFFVTIISIQVIGVLAQFVSPVYLYAFLGIGPALGLLSMRRLR
jgi:MFS family permease